MEYNIYAAYNFSYDFPDGYGYVTPSGFSHETTDIYSYQTNFDISAVSIILFNGTNLPSNMSIECLDENDVVIPGTSSMVPYEPSTKISYTFQNSLSVGRIIRLKIMTDPVNLTGLCCNITVTCVEV